MKISRRRTLQLRFLLLPCMTVAMLLAVPAVAKALTPPEREVVFIIDTSAAVDKVSLRGLKTTLYQGLDALQEKDRFNLVHLNADRRRLFERSMPVDDFSLVEAMDFIDGLVASSHTKSTPALPEEMILPVQAGLVRQLVFIPGADTGGGSLEVNTIGWLAQLLLALATLACATCLLWFCTPSHQPRAGGSTPLF